MIVEPGFLDHWKTRRLVELTGDNTAPLFVLRLWAHCHKAKMWRFRNLTNEKLAGICGWKGEPSEIHTTLTKAGFLNIQGPFLVVHEWEKYNRKLVSCWRNGEKGGRYCKTQQEPNANPIEPKPTHANPPNLILSNLICTSTESTEMKSTSTVPEQDWLKILKASPAYKGIDVEREFYKMIEWCRIKRKRPTKQRFVNWLNGAEAPLFQPTKQERKDPIW